MIALSACLCVFSDDGVNRSMLSRAALSFHAETEQKCIKTLSVMLLTALKSGVLVYSFFTILSGVSGRESKAQQGDPQRIVGPLQLNVTPVSQGNNVPDRKDKTVPTCEMSKDYVKISHVEVLMTDR